MTSSVTHVFLTRMCTWNHFQCAKFEQKDRWPSPSTWPRLPMNSSEYRIRFHLGGVQNRQWHGSGGHHICAKTVPGVPLIAFMKLPPPCLGKLGNGKKKMVEYTYPHYQSSYKYGGTPKGYSSCNTTTIMCHIYNARHYVDVFISLLDPVWNFSCQVGILWYYI